jgi:hypothetical protein
MAMVWLAVSLVCGIGYWLGHALLPAGAVAIAVKGGGVAALAVHARRSGIAPALALGALGDVLIEVNLIAGALAFLAGHGVACRFYWIHRRGDAWPLVAVTAAVLAIAAPVLSGNFGTGIYALGLGAMVGCAGASRFPRSRVALGAVLFAVSDLLLFARLGVLSGSVVPGLLIWPLYYFGQVLIAIGVLQQPAVIPA